MAHNDYLSPFARNSVSYPTVWVPTPKFMSRMDLLSSQAVNMAGGGTWSPSTPIVIGSASSGFTPSLLLTTSGTSISGGVTTGRNGKIRLSNNDIPVFITPRVKTVTIPIHALDGDTQATNGAQTDVDPTFGCGRLLAPGTGEITFAIPPHRLVQGATVTSIVLTMRIGNPVVGGVSRTTIPQFLPSFFMARLSTANALTTMTTTATALVAADLPTYLNAGNSQPITMTPTQNQVIDTTGGHYFLSIIDEHGTNALAPSYNLVHSVAITMSVPDFRFA